MTQEQKRSIPFQGAMTALITPFQKSNHSSENKIDEQALGDLCQKQIQAGIAGLIAAGTTGESMTLSDTEKERIFRIVVEAAAGKALVIAGVGTSSTAHSLELAGRAKAAGVDGLLIVTPAYNRPTQEGLYQHYRLLTGIHMPIVLYNIPSRTGCDLLPDTIARLCDLPQIVALKETTGSIQRAQQIISKVGDRLSLLSGEDAINFPLYCIGAKGCISVLSNLAPALVCKIWNLFTQNKFDQARAFHYQSLPLVDALFAPGESNPVPIKTALHLLGSIEPEFRSPLYPMAPESLKRLQTTLLSEGFIS